MDGAILALKVTHTQFGGVTREKLVDNKASGISFNSRGLSHLRRKYGTSRCRRTLTK
jgi:hypothetical protein